jgi:autophagy-related protein 11
MPSSLPVSPALIRPLSHLAIEADEQAYQELADQLRDVQQAKSALEATSSEERARLQAEVAQLRAHVEDLDASVTSERTRADQLERDLHLTRAQIDGDTKARKVLENRHAELLEEVDSMRRSHAEALAEATEQTKAAELLRQELDQVRTEAEAVKALETRNSDRVTSLMVDQAATLRNLEEARARGEDLEMQIKAARTDSDQVHRALDDARREKDRLLRAQASEHDRIMRDHMVEADSDRAVLQHHFSELKATLEDRTRALKEAKAEIEIQKADAVGLREELQRVELELRESRHAERILREDIKNGRLTQSAVENREERSSRLVAEILAVAIAFRNAQVKAMNTAQAMSAHPNSANKASPALNDSVFHHGSGLSLSPLSAGFRRNVIGHHDEPSPIDPSDPAAALEILRSFDQDLFLEAIAKTGSTIRKWQKQCKEYRERAKGKISFRNFAKGDLALFLPTRNSVSKPWAAFNGKFARRLRYASGRPSAPPSDVWH